MTVKKKGDAYYLYRRTSRRVEGKKYPQPVDTYVGIITPDGVVETMKRKVTLSDIEVREYGFSRAIEELCPQGWKNVLEDECEDVLRALIIRWSPESYLAADYTPRSPESFRCAFSAQGGLLARRIFKEHGIELKDLKGLKTIYLVRIGKEEAVSRISREQQELLDRIGVKLDI